MPGSWKIIMIGNLAIRLDNQWMMVSFSTTSQVVNVFSEGAFWEDMSVQGDSIIYILREIPVDQNAIRSLYSVQGFMYMTFFETFF